MKKPTVILLVLLIVQAFLPACNGLALVLGMEFILSNEIVYLIVAAALTVGAAVLLWRSDEKPDSSLALLVLPVSIVNCIICLWETEWLPAIVCTAAMCICCWMILCRTSIHGFWKGTCCVIAALLTMCFVFFIPVDVLGDGFGYNEVVQEVTSPEGTYTVQLIDSNQGALGGDTLVWLFDNSRTVNILVGRFTPARETVYRGEWGEFMDMTLSWQDDNTLLINEKAYPIG